MARLNRTLAYVAIDRSDRVLSSFRATRNADCRHSRPTLRLRAAWQEAQLLSEIGYLEAAEEMLRFARRGFLERNLAPEVVAASRDLVGIYRKLGKWQPARADRSRDPGPLFRSSGRGRGAHLSRGAGADGGGLDAYILLRNG